MPDPARLAELTALAADHADKAEADRRPTPEVAQAVRDAGFARHFVPARWGGTQGTFRWFLDSTAEVAAADPSAAWVASIAATLGRMAGFLPDAGQRAVWAEHPDALVVGALLPGGEATEAAGGWLLSGRWAFLSGIDHADHALLCCPVPVPGGGREVRFLLVPRSAYEIERTWFTVGMRGTGSDTLVLPEPVFVPHGHSFAREVLLAGRPEASEAHCHRVPLKSVSGLSFAAPALGALDGALTAWTANAAARRATRAGGLGMSGDTAATEELALARAAGETDAARLLLTRAAADADESRPDGARTTRAQRDHALAVDLLVTAVDRLLRTSGTRAQSESDPLQRYWRDVHAAAGHAVLRWEPAARGYAALKLESR
ncbi:hydrolase [Streptomyces lincolnensis]|uniref:hydrolase n=1 Tax=Streptomyces lincolnensis TaxID=1915 RepID=UPI001E63989A|nr:hydrolase [Streptomyces lincolnensis]MCD7439417.1 hydrolase [Streptomyces lincolnensis]